MSSKASPSQTASLNPTPQKAAPPDRAPSPKIRHSSKTLLEEFYRVAFRKRVYDSIEALQADLDAWMAEYNEVRTHQGRWCYGKTPMQTFLDSKAIAREKQQPGLAA